MTALFEIILEMSVKAAIVTVVVMLSRLLLSRAPKKFSYLLWAVVAFRLCVPVSFSSDLSIFVIGSALENGENTVITEAAPPPDTENIGIIIPNDTPAANQTVPADTAVQSGADIEIMDVLAVVWCIGAAAMLAYGAFSYIKINRRMSTATLYERNIYCSENVLSPFTLGFIKPRIYIPYGLDNNIREKIIAHENCHINRFDHIVKPFAFLILAVHWFNPLCWLAFDRMSLDMEMSCDEKLLRTQGDEEMKKTYTNALLSFASNRRFPAPSPVNFNDNGSAKKRIKNALNYKKPKVWVTVLAYVFCAVMLVACVADAKDTEYKDINKNIFAEAPYVITYVSNGDGTCTVTDIIIDYSENSSINVVIPEVSPDGDKVTKVEVKDFNTLTSLNVPVLITEDSFNEIKALLTEKGIEEREIRRVVSFYDSHEQDGILVLEPTINEAEYERLSNILTEAGYTSQNAYDAAVEVVNTVPASSDEAVTLRLQAFDYFYHSANKVKSVTVPEGVKVNGTGNVEIIYCTVETDKEYNTETSSAPDENSVTFTGDNPVNVKEIIELTPIGTKPPTDTQ